MLKAENKRFRTGLFEPEGGPEAVAAFHLGSFG
jgi:hypothetical protein